MKRSNSLKETKCTACDAEAFARFEGVPYCKKHYMQMYHKGKITTRTIYDPNEYILHDDYAECITYDKEWQMGSTYNAQLPNHQLGKLR